MFSYVIKQVVNAQLYTIDLRMHSGGLLSTDTQEARVALGYRLVRPLRFLRLSNFPRVLLNSIRFGVYHLLINIKYAWITRKQKQGTDMQAYNYMNAPWIQMT